MEVLGCSGGIGNDMNVFLWPATQAVMRVKKFFLPAARARGASNREWNPESTGSYWQREDCATGNRRSARERRSRPDFEETTEKTTPQSFFVENKKLRESERRNRRAL